MIKTPYRSPSVVYCAGTSSNTDATSYTFTAAAIGAAGGNRRVAVIVASASGGSPVVSGLTIGGISASEVVGQTTGNGFQRISIWVADVPTGTTANIVVSYAATQGRCGVAVYALYDTSKLQAESTASSTANPSALSLTATGIPSVAIAGAWEGSNSTSFTWSGLTENLDTVIESTSTFGAASGKFTTLGSKTITATPVSSDNTRRAGISAIWR
jgi:hypothetical protein